MSRATWRIFVDTFNGKAKWGLVNAAIKLLSRNRIGELVVTVFLFEVVEPFFSSRLHPYTSLRESLRRHGGRSGPQEPDTDYSAATVSHCMAVSFRVTLG